MAQDFVRMVRPWKLDVSYQKICQAAQEVKKKKTTWEQYAKVEEEIAHQLAQTIKTNINTYDENYFELSLIIKDKKSQCLGYTQ